MAYIDDIVIATETIGDHIERIREVFERSVSERPASKCEPRNVTSCARKPSTWDE